MLVVGDFCYRGAKYSGEEGVEPFSPEELRYEHYGHFRFGFLGVLSLSLLILSVDCWVCCT